LQEFEIQKLFICFDLPLSILNKVQAQSISDIDRYLMVKSIQHIQKEGPAHDQEERALRNYEAFFELPRGAATVARVKASSDGLEGWARWQKPTNHKYL